MRGKPLMICHDNHDTIMFTGSTCPFCRQRAELVTVRAEYQNLRDDVRLAHAKEQAREGLRTETEKAAV